MKIILAAVLAGLTMFCWGFVSHMMLGMGKTSMKMVKDEAALTEALKANLTETGTYFVPGFDPNKEPTEAEMTDLAARYKVGPTAAIFYHPDGDDLMSIGKLGTELGSNLVAALFAAVIIGMAGVGFGRALFISVLIGLIGWLSISISYMNWYRFSLGFTTDELLDQGLGWLLSGVVLALILRKKD